MTRSVGVFGRCDHNNLWSIRNRGKQREGEGTSGPIAKRAVIAARAVSSFTILIPSASPEAEGGEGGGGVETTQELSFELVGGDHVGSESRVQ
jgi:hypothetical protein